MHLTGTMEVVGSNPSKGEDFSDPNQNSNVCNLLQKALECRLRCASVWRVITTKSYFYYIFIVVHIFINLSSLLPKIGCPATICWSEYSTCVFSKIYSKLLRYIFLFVFGLGIIVRFNLKLKLMANKNALLKKKFHYLYVTLK